MANYCNNQLLINGDTILVSTIESVMRSLDAESDFFSALLNGDSKSTAGNQVGYGVLKEDLSYEKISSASCVIQFDTKNEYPDGLYKNLSVKFNCVIEASFEIEADNVKGVLWYNNGTLQKKESYSYMEGFYKLESPEDFWAETEEKMENDFLNNYDSFEELVENEFLFLSTQDKTKLKTLYEEMNGAD